MEKDVNLLEELRNLNDLENNLRQLDGFIKSSVPLLKENDYSQGTAPPIA